MSTLPPKPVFDPNVPIVSSAGGSTAAYKDPTSAESIMRKTATVNAQAIVDSQFDVAEGFIPNQLRKNQFLLSFLLLLFFYIVVYKFVQEEARPIFIGFIMLLLLLILQKKDTNGYSY